MEQGGVYKTPPLESSCWQLMALGRGGSQFSLEILPLLSHQCQSGWLTIVHRLTASRSLSGLQKRMMRLRGAGVTGDVASPGEGVWVCLSKHMYKIIMQCFLRDFECYQFFLNTMKTLGFDKIH